MVRKFESSRNTTLAEQQSHSPVTTRFVLSNSGAKKYNLPTSARAFALNNTLSFFMVSGEELLQELKHSKIKSRVIPERRNFIVVLDHEK